jgi:hypothetical protein
MLEQSYKSKLIKVNTEDKEVIYHLIFEDAFYSMESNIDGNIDRNHYSYLEAVTDDEGEAEYFLKLLAKGKVHPVHIKDMAEDYFGK